MAIVAELKFSTVVSIKQATFVDFNIYVYIYICDRPLGTILFGLVLMFLALLTLQCF